jgi:hypothetical protein
MKQNRAQSGAKSGSGQPFKDKAAPVAGMSRGINKARVFASRLIPRKLAP